MATYIKTATFPCQNARELVEAHFKSLEENPLPDYIKEIGFYTTVDKDGWVSGYTDSKREK